jgi:hypothetical protein
MTKDDKDIRCHVLSIYDGVTEQLIDAIEIKDFDLSLFIQQFDVCPESDPEMLLLYGVGPDDVEFVVPRLEKPIDFQFSTLAYFIEAANKH